MWSNALFNFQREELCLVYSITSPENSRFTIREILICAWTLLKKTYIYTNSKSMKNLLRQQTLHLIKEIDMLQLYLKHRLSFSVFIMKTRYKISAITPYQKTMRRFWILLLTQSIVRMAFHLDVWLLASRMAGEESLKYLIYTMSSSQNKI